MAVCVLVCISIGGFFFALNEAQRALVLTTDSIMYADTARHIAAGQGVTTGILELDSTVAPRPQTQWPPFYAMLMAPLIKAGVSPVDAGRYVSAGAFCLLILLVGLWLMRLHPTAGIAAASALLVVPGITKISAAVWADSTYAVIVLAVAWIGTVLIERPRPFRSFALGSLIGIGILTKYLGIILIGAGVAIQLLSWFRHRRLNELLKHLGFTLLGIAIFVGPLLAFNLSAGRPIGGAVRTLSSQPFSDILHDTGSALSHDLTANWMLWSLLALAVVSIAFMASCAARRSSLPETWRRHLIVPVAVTVVYIIGLIAARALIDTDRIHTRFLAPVYPLVIVTFIVLIDAAARCSNSRARTIILSAIAVVSIGWTIKTYDFRAGPYVMPGSHASRWAETSTTSRDLIIGNNAAEFAFRYGYMVIRLGREAHDMKLTPELLAAVTDRWQNSFDRIFIALTPNLDARRYGDYTAAISNKDPSANLTFIDERPGQVVYLVYSSQ